MTSAVQRPRGRRPGQADTKAEIKSAALVLFSEQGYEKVSLRAIARAAGVDPALIHHYFESKADLFARSVLDLPLEAELIVDQILDGPRDGIGERTIAALLQTWDQPGAKERLTAMLRAAVTDSSARRPLSEFLVREVLVKVAEGAGSDDPRLRGHLAMTQILGLILGRDILALPALTKTKAQTLVVALGRAMQSLLVEPW